jgi:alpha-L-fucosidase
MPDGRIEPRQVESFRKIGQWLEKHGESIYGTRGGPFVSPNMNARKFGAARHSFALPAGQWWGGSTRKGNVVYLHILRWPSDTIMLPNIGREIITHTVLTGGQATVTQNADGIQVSVPSDQRDRLDTIVKLELDGSAMDIAPRSVVPAQFRGAISIGKKAIASGVWPGGQYNAAMALDGDPSTRWGGAQDSRSGWLAIDLGKPMAFNRVVILEEPWNRVQKFELQIKDGDNWKVFHEGATLGNFSKTFKTITAQEIRLNILEASNVPTLWEFQLLEVGRTAN